MWRVVQWLSYNSAPSRPSFDFDDRSGAVPIGGNGESSAGIPPGARDGVLAVYIQEPQDDSDDGPPPGSRLKRVGHMEFGDLCAEITSRFDLAKYGYEIRAITDVDRSPINDDTWPDFRSLVCQCERATHVEVTVVKPEIPSQSALPDLSEAMWRATPL